MPEIQTRSQRMLAIAYECVAEVATEPEPLRRIYGTIARDFGVVVRTSGLAQAVAFADAKQGSDNDRKRAYAILLRHLARVLEAEEANLVSMIASASGTSYLEHTQRLLSTWVYFRRFVVSLLKVDSPTDPPEVD